MKKSQQGFINPGDFKGMLWMIAGVAAVTGWAVIETILWLLSHISIGWA